MKKIPADRIVDVVEVSGWSVGFIRPPKLHIICGSCYRPSASRNWSYLNNAGNKVVVPCGYCGLWNKTELVYG